MEPKLDLSTVRKWRATGRLASDWQENLALQMLRADEGAAKRRGETYEAS